MKDDDICNCAVERRHLSLLRVLYSFFIQFSYRNLSEILIR